MTAAATTQESKLNNFLYGMALFNHSTYCHSKWKTDEGCMQKIIAYTAGMGEHIVYVLSKVITACAFFFLSFALTVHYLIAYALKMETTEITKRKVRVMISYLVLAETLPGICIDATGVICPPLADKVHLLVKEKVTRRVFEKWGVIDHTMSSEEFASLNYFKAK